MSSDLITPIKQCFKCLCMKPLTEFYKHSMMADKHLNKCKPCTRSDVIENRNAKIDHYRAFDRMRASMPHRVAARKEYTLTPEGRATHAKALKVSNIKFPKRASARYKFANAVRAGKLTKTPCHVCGHEKVEGHHPDYDRPLDVVWLCNTHHRAAHKLAVPF